MIWDNFLVHGFDPLFLTLDRIGPFRQPEEINFTDNNNVPCNLFLLMSANGYGKTTVLESMAALMGLLGKDTIDKTGQEDMDRAQGSAQLDLLLDVTHEGERFRAIFSLCAGWGTPDSLKSWDEEQLAIYETSQRYVHGFERLSTGRFQSISSKEILTKDMVFAVRQALGERPSEVQDTSLLLPNMIFFTAYRDFLPIKAEEKRPIIEPDNWGYQPVKTYDRGVQTWSDSPDSLLVWLKWLDANNGTDNLGRMIRIVNEDFFGKAYKGAKVLMGVRTQPPEGIVKNEGEEHRLDRLSSGEKSILQLLLRIPTDMTRKTIVLIDELDVHLHPNWERLVLIILKKMAQEFPGLTFIFSTHAMEMLDVLDHETEESDLVKGGIILEKELR